jgi:nuclear transport factor 2 (NTF2) superfamily protein
VAVTREDIEGILGMLQEHMASGDMAAWTALFSGDCEFRNSAMTEPVIGRTALLALAESWPRVDNQQEWHAIDGNRLVVGWNERQESTKESARRYRGFSTFVFDESGLISNYEGMFDTAAVFAAMNA